MSNSEFVAQIQGLSQAYHSTPVTLLTAKWHEGVVQKQLAAIARRRKTIKDSTHEKNNQAIKLVRTRF
jgi:hypothetical protein